MCSGARTRPARKAALRRTRAVMSCASRSTLNLLSARGGGGGGSERGLCVHGQAKQRHTVLECLVQRLRVCACISSGHSTLMAPVGMRMASQLGGGGGGGGLRFESAILT
jgi:hypothetical protein